MASFEKAWAVTNSWEGPWKPFEKRDVANDPGDCAKVTKSLTKALTKALPL